MKKLLIYLSLLASVYTFADTGFKDLIRVTESDNSPSCMAGQIKFANGDVTCSGNVATVADQNTGGGGGASTLEAFVGAARSSPTPSISGYTGDFFGTVVGSTFYFVLNPATTNYIHNKSNVQAANFSVSSGTVSNGYAVTASTHPFIAVSTTGLSSLGLHFNTLPISGGFGPQVVGPIFYGKVNEDLNGTSGLILWASTSTHSQGTNFIPNTNGTSLLLYPPRTGGSFAGQTDLSFSSPFGAATYSFTVDKFYAPYGIEGSTGIFSTSLTVAGKSVCLEDGTDCPAGGAGDAVLGSSQTWAARNLYTSTAAIVLNATTASLPVQTDAHKNLVTAQISDAQIADGAVDGGSGGEIADGSVTSDDLGTDSVSADELNATGVESELEAVLDLDALQGQIADGQIADGAVDGGSGGEIADGTVDANDLATDSVSADELNATGVESELEAVLDLQQLQGAVLGSQLPNTVPSSWTVAGSGLSVPYGINTTTVSVTDDAYDGTGWNGVTFVPTKNAIRDKIEAMPQTAGRSLILTGVDVAADAELYTDTKCIWFENPTASDDFKTIWTTNIAATITGISCESDQTVNFDLQVDDGSATGVNGSDIACTTFARDSSLAGDTTLAAGDRLDLAVASVSGTPTWVSICWDFTYDD